MPDELDLMQLAAGGQKLARVDDADYLAVSVVFVWPQAGTPAIYCLFSDWPQTPAARLAERDLRLAELGEAFSLQAGEALKQAQRAEAAERRVSELERQLAASPSETPVQDQAKMFQAQAASLNEENGARPMADPGPCPDCGEAGWKSARALQMHRQRSHQGMRAIKAARVQFVEELGWRCAAKGCTGAHARDLHDPMFCIQHAVHTNGVEATTS